MTGKDPTGLQGREPWEDNLAGGLGFEPRLTESESVVLPLDDPPGKRCDPLLARNKITSSEPLSKLACKDGLSNIHLVYYDATRQVWNGMDRR